MDGVTKNNTTRRRGMRKRMVPQKEFLCLPTRRFHRLFFSFPSLFFSSRRREKGVSTERYSSEKEKKRFSGRERFHWGFAMLRFQSPSLSFYFFKESLT
jgi:hypothetical protein